MPPVPSSRPTTLATTHHVSSGSSDTHPSFRDHRRRTTRFGWGRIEPSHRGQLGLTLPLDHLIELSKELKSRQIDLVVLDQGIDTSTALGRMFFQLLGAIAEFEHALMSERTRDGLAAARARGRVGGPKHKLRPRQVQLARQMYDQVDDQGRNRYTVAEIAAEFGVSRPTIYRYLERPVAGGRG